MFLNYVQVRMQIKTATTQFLVDRITESQVIRKYIHTALLSNALNALNNMHSITFPSRP